MKSIQVLPHTRAACLATALAFSTAHAVTWDGTTASFDDAPSWDTNAVPVAAETVTLANGGTIQIGGGVLAPATGALGNITVTSGTLSVSGGTLTTSGTIANGATGITTISSGTITGSTLGSFGVATNGGLSNTVAGGTWSVSNGTVNLNGVGASLGGSQSITGGIVKTQDLRNAGGSTLTISGGTTTIGKFTAGSSGTGTVIVSGSAIVEQNITGQNASGSNNECWVGNNVSTGTLTLKDSAQWNYTFYNANSSVNFGRGQGNHVFTLQDTASFTTQVGTGALKAVVVGDANASARGTVNLDGGTLTVLGLAKGSGTGVINANGGLIKAAGNSGNFFAGFTGTGGAANTSNSVNLLAGGLKFDSNTFDVASNSPLSGTGGMEKLGAGSLTLSGACTYSGNTTVTAGELVLSTAFLHDDSKLTIEAGALVNLSHGIEDVVETLDLDGTVITSGTWGSTSSPATNQNDDFFVGTGVIRVGEPVVGRDLTWTGGETPFWSAFPDLNFTDPLDTDVAFATNDNVTFDDTSTVTTVILAGQVQAGAVIFNGSQPYFIDGAGAGLSGNASIVMNNTGTVTLGGENSNFTGTIAVNAGILKMGNNAAFGANTGITIVNGAQVDINGKVPTSIHSYTVGGTGPGGSGIIINSSATDVFSGGGVKNLTLTADTTIGNNGGRFDVGGSSGTITGNGLTLTKIGTSNMALRGNASGTPIHYVIAGGSAWTENSALGFGGATGMLTIKSGAQAGNVGDFTIATPVTLESGGTLYSNGGTGTWTGTIGVAGDVTFAGTAGPVVINGVLSGNANVTKNGTNNVTFSASALPGNVGHVGNTTVAAGRLVLGSPALADDGDVTVAATAFLNLGYTGQDTVDTLTLGGVQVAAGVWGSTTSGAANTSPMLEGTGTLLVITAGAPNPYGNWALANGVSGGTAETDSDQDGIPNGIEFVIGGDPSGPGSDSSALLPTASTDETYLNFVFRRSDDSAGYSPFVEYGSTLAAPWTPAQGGVDGVIIDEVNGAGMDQVTVRIPRGLAADGKIFARLHVTIP